MIAQDRQPYVNSLQDAALQFFGCPTVIRSTGETTDNHFFLMESLSMPPGLASPYYVHHNEDEAFYVLEGELAIVLDGKWMTRARAPGSYGPRDIPSGFNWRHRWVVTPKGFGLLRDVTGAPTAVSKRAAARSTPRGHCARGNRLGRGGSSTSRRRL